MQQRIPTHRTPVASKSTTGVGATRRKGFPPEAGEAGRKTQTARANAHALMLSPIIAEIQAHGVTHHTWLHGARPWRDGDPVPLQPAPR
jgi:hypothetical protein